ncbi:MAG: hypothetical protein R3C08_01735 [Hyphomonas sp.]
MSALRLLILALIPPITTLPTLAQITPDFLRGTLDAEFLQDAEEAEGEEQVMPLVLVTKTAPRQSLLVSKPAILRYPMSSAMPVRTIAETRGKEPEPAVTRTPENR